MLLILLLISLDCVYVIHQWVLWKRYKEGNQVAEHNKAHIVEETVTVAEEVFVPNTRRKDVNDLNMMGYLK